ncbi:HAMP domain-containing histidine kinase [bacterium]|nr:HAMP domain-containing histidine kinase [bacterium]
MAWKSIRWRLPLSYAAIALITAFAMGALLLTMLRSYYDQRERDYMENNAEAIRSAIAQMVEHDTSLAIIQAQIVSFSFLSQVRIQILDAEGGVIVDSGLPGARNFLAISAQPNADAEVDDGAGLPPATERGFPILETEYAHPLDFHAIRARFGEGDDLYSPVITLDFVRGPQSSDNDALAGGITDDGFTYVLPATGTLFGFGLNNEMPEPDQYSSQRVVYDIHTTNGDYAGTVVLSAGPAYGNQIVERVARGLLVATVLAVALATGAGWTISQRISRPLLALKAVTEQMAEGHLSVRANIHRDDEFGMLALVFNTMAQRIEETVVMLRRFVADAAHELHTPLTALQTNLELAVDAAHGSGNDLYIQRAHQQVKRLEALTDGLLDLSRIEAGTHERNRELIAFHHLVSEISEIYASRCEQAEVNFVLSLPSTPIMLYGHAGQLRRVLNNLLDNALKFTPAGETIELYLHPEAEWVRLTVRDYGIGIPAEEQAFIFERFHRCRNAVAYEGSGLGLAIVQGIIHTHEGRIYVEAAGPGTRFIVTLPLHSAPTAPPVMN